MNVRSVTDVLPVVPATPYGLRLVRLREDLCAAGIDAFVVTQLTNVRYLTGFNGSAGALLVTRSMCVLIVDFRYATAARDLQARRSDGDVTLEVADRSCDETIVATLQRVEATRIGIEAGSMPVSRFNRMSATLASSGPGLATVKRCPVLVPTERIVERRRLIKDAGEIATLREAGRRISAVALELPALVQRGRSELEIAADVEAAMRSGGFDRPAFETIVASGENSALPHARPSRRLLQAGDAVVVDFGGVYDGYCVDLTRTLEVGAGKPALRRLFDAVAEAHGAAIAAVRPGVLASAIDAAARKVLVRHGLGEAFGHGTGHGIGLEVHEEPRIAKTAFAQLDLPVEPGMAFTIEPGAYVAGLGGVRIEDDVLVVDGGCELLTAVPVEFRGPSA